jgi:hypothetical protein
VDFDIWMTNNIGRRRVSDHVMIQMVSERLLMINGVTCAIETELLQIVNKACFFSKSFYDP